MGERSVAPALVERARPFLQEGEEIKTAEVVVCVATAVGARPRGVPGAPGAGLRVGGAVGNRLARMGAVKGESDSIARSIPYQRGGIVLGVTERRVGLWSGPAMGEPAELWSAPREVVTRVQRRPRLQLLARFRLHFADGSTAAFMTPKRASIERLANLLGR